MPNEPRPAIDMPPFEIGIPDMRTHLNRMVDLCRDLERDSLKAIEYLKTALERWPWEIARLSENSQKWKELALAEEARADAAQAEVAALQARVAELEAEVSDQDETIFGYENGDFDP